MSGGAFDNVELDDLVTLNDIAPELRHLLEPGAGMAFENCVTGERIVISDQAVDQ